MNYYNKATNFIQSTSFPGALIFPDRFWDIYHMPGKRAAGFVDSLKASIHEQPAHRAEKEEHHDLY